MSSPPMHWRAIGFDLDGTLFDHVGAAEEAVSEFVADLGCEPTAEHVAAWFTLEATHFESWRAGRMSFVEQRRRRLQEFLPLLGVAAPEGDDLLDGLFGTYLLLYRRAWRAFPGATAVLEDLRGRGVRLGILTNGSEEQQRDKLNVTGLRPLIDVVCTSEVLGVAKPDPRAFEMLAERLGCATSEMAFVGDNSEMDVAGARAAGVAAGLVRYDDVASVGLMAAIRSASL